MFTTSPNLSHFTLTHNDLSLSTNKAIIELREKGWLSVPKEFNPLSFYTDARRNVLINGKPYNKSDDYQMAEEEKAEEQILIIAKNRTLRRFIAQQLQIPDENEADKKTLDNLFDSWHQSLLYIFTNIITTIINEFNEQESSIFPRSDYTANIKKDDNGIFLEMTTFDIKIIKSFGETLSTIPGNVSLIYRLTPDGFKFEKILIEGNPLLKEFCLHDAKHLYQTQSRFNWKNILFISAGIIFALTALSGFVALTLFTSGAALPLFVALGTTAASFSGVTILTSTVSTVGGVLFAALASPLAALVGGAGGYLTNKITNGITNFLWRKKQAPDGDYIPLDSLVTYLASPKHSTTSLLLKNQKPANRVSRHSNNPSQPARKSVRFLKRSWNIFYSNKGKANDIKSTSTTIDEKDSTPRQEV